MDEAQRWVIVQIPTLVVMFNSSRWSLWISSSCGAIFEERPVVTFIKEESSARIAGVELGHVLLKALKVNGIDVKNNEEASRLIKVCSSICRCNNELLCYPSRSWACTLGEGLYFSIFLFFMMFDKSFVCVIEKWHTGQVSWVFVISSNKFKMLQRVPAPNSNTFVDFSPSFRKFSSTWSLSKAKAPYRLSMETTLHLAHAICFSRIRKIVVSVIK